MKYSAKKVMATRRRAIFQTGGGPPLSDLNIDERMENVLSDQMPIDGVNDDDHNDSEIEHEHNAFLGSTNNQIDEPVIASSLKSPVICFSTQQNQSESSSRNKSHFTGIKKVSIVTKLALQFHKRKIDYLEQEHNLKMKILQKAMETKEIEHSIVLKSFHNGANENPNWCDRSNYSFN
jgi:hypothetical protein